MNAFIHEQVTKLAEDRLRSWSLWSSMWEDIDVKNKRHLTFLKKRRSSELACADEMWAITAAAQFIAESVASDMTQHDWTKAADEGKRWLKKYSKCFTKLPDQEREIIEGWQSERQRVENWYSEAVSTFWQREAETEQEAIESLNNYRSVLLPFIEADSEYLLHVHHYDVEIEEYVNEAELTTLCQQRKNARDDTTIITKGVHAEIMAQIHRGDFDDRQHDTLDFRKKRDRYWGNRLQLDVLNTTEKKLLHQGASAGRAARVALQERLKFWVKCMVPAMQLFGHVEGMNFLKIEPISESFFHYPMTGECAIPDSIETTAWIRASTKLYGSVRAGLKEFGRGGSWNEVYTNWLLFSVEQQENLTYRTAVHLAKSEHSKISKAVRMRKSTATEKVEKNEFLDSIPDFRSPRPEAEIERFVNSEQESSLMAQTIQGLCEQAKLSPAEKEVFLWRFSGLKETGIANRLGKPVGTVRSLDQRAKRKIKALGKNPKDLKYMFRALSHKATRA